MTSGYIAECAEINSLLEHKKRREKSLFSSLKSDEEKDSLSDD